MRQKLIWGGLFVVPILLLCVLISVRKAQHKDSGVPDEDWQQALQWRQSPAFTNAVNTYLAIARGAEKRGDLTDDEIRTITKDLQNTQTEAMALRTFALESAQYASSEHSRSLLEPYVINCLTDKVSAVRGMAVATLLAIGDETSITNLDPLLKDPNHNVAIAAGKARTIMLKKASLKK